MARYGALTALQAALLGVSGGAQGLVQARERERRELERVRQAERETASDALERERFGLEQRRGEAEQRYREAQLRQQAEMNAADIASREKIARENAAAAERESEEARRVSRLAGSAFLEQARQPGGGVGTQLLGRAIANEVLRLGRQLNDKELADMSSAVAQQIGGERRMLADEARAAITNPFAPPPPQPPPAGVDPDEWQEYLRETGQMP